VFDAYSYSSVSDTTPLGQTVYSSYLPNWQDSVTDVITCRTLYNIFVGTILIFVLECLVILSHFFRALFYLLRCGEEDKSLRVASLVEFPLIGFIIVLFLRDEDLKLYVELDRVRSLDSHDFSRLMGLDRPGNILMKKVKPTLPIFPTIEGCCTGPVCCSSDLPPPVRLGQAIIYPCLLPFTNGFWCETICNFSTFSHGIVTVFIALPLSVLIYAAQPGYFLSNCILYLFVILIWGTRFYTHRVVHDIPNLCMTIAFMINVKVLYGASAVSAIVSALLIIVYMTILVKDSWKCRAQYAQALSNVYGPLSRCQKLWLASFQTFVLLLSWWFYMPALLCNSSSFVPVVPDYTAGHNPASDHRQLVLQEAVVTQDVKKGDYLEVIVNGHHYAMKSTADIAAGQKIFIASSPPNSLVDGGDCFYDSPIVIS